MTTLAPAWQKTSEAPSPIPCAPPVMMATCPSSLVIFIFLILIFQIIIILSA